ncbi:MAG: hypothetical protein ACRDZO_14470, partial [Egibacteraceae bacterium]
LYELGFSAPAGLEKVAGDGYGGSVSAERPEILDTDVLVWFAEPGDPTIQNDPLYRTLAVRTEGRDLFIGAGDPLEIPITGFITVLKPRSCSTDWSPGSSRLSTATPPPPQRSSDDHDCP